MLDVYSSYYSSYFLFLKTLLSGYMLLILFSFVFLQKVKHSKLADNVDLAITDKKYFPNTNVDTNQLFTCYPPIIQSGEKYSLKFSTTRYVVIVLE